VPIGIDCRDCEITESWCSTDEQEIYQPMKKANFSEIESAVIQWSKNRRIIPNSTPVSQYLKAASEMGELADAINKGDRDATIDAIGDVVVCLINLCALEGLEIAGCLESAYDQIKDRKGTLLPSGVFVKEEA
jgi:MazG nucleotide pyrophosphohydrolase domain